MTMLAKLNSQRMALVVWVAAVVLLASTAFAGPITPSARRNASTSATYDVVVAGLLGGAVQQQATGTGFLASENTAFNVGYDIGSAFESWPILEFDLSGLGFDGTNAFLNLYLIGGVDSSGIYYDSALVPSGYRTSIADPLEIGIYGYAGDGVYDVFGDAVQGSLLSTLVLTQTGQISVNLNAFVQSLLQGGNSWLGLNLRPVVDPSVQQQNVFFYRPPVLGALGSGTLPGQLQGLPPLDPVPVPEPTTIMLVLSGSVGACFLRRRVAANRGVSS